MYKANTLFPQQQKVSLAKLTFSNVCQGCSTFNNIYCVSISFFDGNTPHLLSSEQEDPRLKIPVHMRRRASLDPSDLGPLPVSSSVTENQ